MACYVPQSLRSSVGAIAITHKPAVKISDLGRNLDHQQSLIASCDKAPCGPALDNKQANSQHPAQPA
jgi:hypothetical protein